MPNNKRKYIAGNTELEILRRSRRRCCLCFGLYQNKEIRQGQIAHLDQDRSNSKLDNLAWLCLEHHDQYDSKSSQSKSITILEVKSYRKELYSEFESWGQNLPRNQLLNFLSKTIGLEEMLDGAINIAGQYIFSPAHLNLLYSVFTDKVFETIDGDLWLPRLGMLQDFESFGWLRFTFEELEGGPVGLLGKPVRLTTEHFKICEQVLDALRKRHPETVTYAEFMNKNLAE